MVISSLLRVPLILDGLAFVSLDIIIQAKDFHCVTASITRNSENLFGCFLTTGNQDVNRSNHRYVISRTEGRVLSRLSLITDSGVRSFQVAPEQQ